MTKYVHLIRRRTAACRIANEDNAAANCHESTFL